MDTQVRDRFFESRCEYIPAGLTVAAATDDLKPFAAAKSRYTESRWSETK